MRARLWTLLALATLACGEPAEPAQDEETRAPARLGEVMLAEGVADRVGIVIGQARAGAAIPEGTIPAELVPEPTRVARVASLVPGRIERVEVQVGDLVEAGARLASIASAEAADLTSAARQASARVAAAEAALARQRALQATGVGAGRALVEAETELAQAEAELAGFTRQRGVLGSGRRGGVDVVAPIAGHVVEVHAAPGSAIDAGTPLFVIVDARRVWAVGRAPERLAGTIATGDAVRLRLFAHGAERWNGALEYVAPMLDPDTHALEVRMALDNPDGRLRPGLLGALELTARDRPDAVVVPREAVVNLEGADVVFVPGEVAGSFRVVPVAVARRDADEAIIVHGLEAGAPVVVAGTFVLQSELLRGELEDEGD